MQQLTGERRSGSLEGKEFQEILGPAEGRYFGGGFRRVAHSVNDLTAIKSPSQTELYGVGSADYPRDWSLDASGVPREIHLSTFDAVALTAKVLKETAAKDDLVQELLMGTVRSVRVKAPTRVRTSMSAIEISARITREISGFGGWCVVSRVGGFTVDLAIGPDNQGLPEVDLQLHTPDGDAIFTTGWVAALGPSGVRTVQELVTVRSVPTVLDEMAMFGQLSQIAVYLVKGADRQRLPNLWLRQLSLQRSAGFPPGRIEACTALTRDRLLRVGDSTLADVRVASETNYGAAVQASFGYRVQ
jgi:hypothetical protein